MENYTTEEIKYPFIVFEAAENLYCVNSKYVSTIMQIPEFEQVPEAPPEITGLFLSRGETVTMVDLRKLLNKKTLEEEYQDFCGMMEERKQDHVEWVNALEHTAQTGDKFKLATDPHKCKLGKWYYSFKSDNQEVNFHLHKLEEPHCRLHEAALEVESCLQDCDNCKRPECLKKVLERVRQESMPQILGLLDQTKEIFRSTVYHEMVLVLNGEKKYGVVVDKVLAVEQLPILGEEEGHVLGMARLVANVRRSDKIQGIILELDIPALLEDVGNKMGISPHPATL